MSGWFVVYFITCLVNAYLTWNCSGFSASDWQAWLWILIPGIAYGCGAKIEKGE